MAATPIASPIAVQFEELHVLSSVLINVPGAQITPTTNRFQTLSDPRLGRFVSELDAFCQGCGLETCHGHFGHVLLPFPVVHPLYATEFNRAVRAYCVHCGKRCHCKQREGLPPSTDLNQVALLTGCESYLTRKIFVTGWRSYTRSRKKHSWTGCELTQALSNLIRDANSMAAAGSAHFEWQRNDLQTAVNEVFAQMRKRLKSKEGLLRKYLLGKRGDMTARTVVTGDPEISVCEVGVPRTIAEELSLRNGDRVVLNRQPTLHRGSMMAHRVRVMDCSTIRLNAAATKSYNADFDGDEMNLHAPMALNVLSELEEILAVERVPPTESQLGLLQDGKLGVWLMRERPRPVERWEVDEAFMLVGMDELADGVETSADLADRVAEHFGGRLQPFYGWRWVDAMQRLGVWWATGHSIGGVDCEGGGFAEMIAAGSKGNALNQHQVQHAVGEQWRSGQLLGEVESSYLKGLTPREFWIHSQSGRDGLIDSATKVADTGYLRRRLAFLLADWRVRHDQSVRNGAGELLQFRYGGDGVNPSLSQFLTQEQRERIYEFEVFRRDVDWEKVERVVDVQRSGWTGMGKGGRDRFGEWLWPDRRAEVEAGDGVGMWAADAFSHAATQLTLDAFHSTGSDHVLTTTGMPQFNRLLNGSERRVQEVLVEYGVEAAVGVCRRKLAKVLRDNGIRIHPSHLELIVDVMFRTGDLQGYVYAKGAKNTLSTLALAGFERPVQTFMAAAVEKRQDRLTHPMSRIIMGMQPWEDRFGLELGLEELAAFSRELPSELFANEAREVRAQGQVHEREEPGVAVNLAFAPKLHEDDPIFGLHSRNVRMRLEEEEESVGEAEFLYQFDVARKIEAYEPSHFTEEQRYVPADEEECEL